MPKFYALSHIGGETPRAEMFPKVSLRELELRSLASVSLRKAGTVIEGTWPEPEQVLCRSDWTVLWTAPGQFLVESSVKEHPDLAADLRSKYDQVSVTEQTGAWAKLELSGASAIEVLRKLVMLDLDRFEDGEVRRTLVEHIGVYLYKTSSARWNIYTPSSTARSMWKALTTACETLESSR